MQPDPSNFPGFFPAQWQFAQFPYMQPPWHHLGDRRPHQPMNQPSGYGVRPQADPSGRKLLEALQVRVLDVAEPLNQATRHCKRVCLQEVYPKLPAAVVFAIEMHVTVSARHEDPGTMDLVPLGNLFDAASHGWCAQST